MQSFNFLNISTSRLWQTVSSSMNTTQSHRKSFTEFNTIQIIIETVTDLNKLEKMNGTQVYSVIVLSDTSGYQD